MTARRKKPAPIFLFTDFGEHGPYVGQMKAAIHRIAPTLTVVDLCHDLAPFQIRPAAHLLAALLPHLPPEACVVAVVDPGVGTARRGVMLEADGIRVIGPDNGLLAIAARRARRAVWRYLAEPADGISVTFHGRDWFGPIAARLQDGRCPPLIPLGDEDRPEGLGWLPDWNHVVYIDAYGNAMTGLRADGLGVEDVILIRDEIEIRHARTFGEVPYGKPFWYANSCGLAELAVSQGDAAGQLRLTVGHAFDIRPQPRAAPDAT